MRSRVVYIAASVLQSGTTPPWLAVTTRGEKQKRGRTSSCFIVESVFISLKKWETHPVTKVNKLLTNSSTLFPESILHIMQCGVQSTPRREMQLKPGHQQSECSRAYLVLCPAHRQPGLLQLQLVRGPK